MPSQTAVFSGASSLKTMLAAATTALGLIAFTNTDMLVEHGFAAALQSDTPARTAAAQSNSQVAGTEDFWLRQSHQPQTGAAPLHLVSEAARLAIGDSLKVTVAGVERDYEVIEVTALPSVMTHIATGPATRLSVITCRDKANPDAPPLRLISEVAAGEAPALAASPRAL